MRTIREVLRLKWQTGLSNRDIATSCKISATAVRGYVARAIKAGLSWPLRDDLQDAQLEPLLFPEAAKAGEQERPKPELTQVQRELMRKGVTRRLLWEEYQSKNPTGYSYSQFCELYRSWAKTKSPTMLQPHKAGDKLFVDYCGLTMPIVDPKTGEVTEAQVFVAALGASHYLFAEATLTQSMADWIGSHVRCFAYLGGVPRLVVPDNLKSGVTAPCYYEPDVNQTYLRFANHYGTAVLPARVRRPKDKAKVENGVQQVERRILARLRNHTFHSLVELNQAIAALLETLNQEHSKHLGASRRELFLTLDKPALGPLPEHSFIVGAWSRAGVNLDYHIVADEHRYSVPYTLIGQEVEVRLSERTVEVFHGGARVASHLRSFVRHSYTTLPEHMPQNHQKACWQEERFLREAKQHGPKTVELLGKIIQTRAVREQGYRSCFGVLGLARHYGSQRLETACACALSEGALRYQRVRDILKLGLDAPKQQEPEHKPSPILHQNVRGADYYAAHQKEAGHA